MLKFLFPFVIVSNLVSAECLLDKPLKLKKPDLLEGAYLQGLVLDETPRFTRPEAFDPKHDKLHMRLFNIEWNGKLTGFLGASVGISEKNETVGFSGVYVGSGGFEGGTEIQGGETVYHTTRVTDFWGEHHEGKEGFYEVKASVKDGYLQSVELHYPIFGVWKELQSGSIVKFIGEHQTICLKSAEGILE